MHFVNRSQYKNAPITELAELHKQQQPEWLRYKNWLATKQPPEAKKPGNFWTLKRIKNPLMQLFKNNCGYCGEYAGEKNSGEVDHFFPKEADIGAEFIYAWDNYVWACHSCNNLKRNHYTLINPCCEEETNEILFISDGRYKVRDTADEKIQEKFALTETKTWINGNNYPRRRRNINQFMEVALEDIKRCKDIYDTEKSIDENSEETRIALTDLEKAKADFREYLAACDFILLKMFLLEKYKKANPSFTYSYSELIP